MTRKDIISQLTERTGLTVSQATHALEGIMDVLADALAKDETIFLRGFGTITTVLRKAKVARDIGREKSVYIPQRKRVKFIAYKKLQSRIDHAEEN